MVNGSNSLLEIVYSLFRRGDCEEAKKTCDSAPQHITQILQLIACLLPVTIPLFLQLQDVLEIVERFRCVQRIQQTLRRIV